ncbi:chemotaxis response regulator protein-glutamate methylesterase [Brevundimonas sp. LM2]|uniref:protein-glutamate methylesterase/protein-glutamine glutaminase n=1 Tax=Brevundimonas sp. LM2 TaxID=1938605 RepID=UPI0009839207|nr:chemotaxis response regulator protein-glutamate methylesterase [Brevundimonas sp. LM2]AQR62564.1 chemotaxis response regulator protein-glutamate methylesterase [Brevundimonas sp. LM2]
MSRPIRVLVVDDSATMRALIIDVLRSDPDLQVIGQAADPIEARTAIKELNPDVVTLDIEMPNMNGLEFLERLMRLRPIPVVMVSTLTQRGADISVAALALGAIDCIGKPVVGGGEGFRELAAKVKAAAQARMQPAAAAAPPAPPASDYRPSGAVVAIGASTGGVEALIKIISTFPANCPPTVITQHMPVTFTASLAARLDRLSAPSVSVAQDDDELRVGHVYLAPGDRHLRVNGGRVLRCALADDGPISGHKPSVDALFASVAAAVGAKAVGVILTGMGKDGAAGLLSMREAGAATIGQDQDTSVVFGMPRAAFEIGAVQRQLALPRIAAATLTAASTTPGAR